MRKEKGEKGPSLASGREVDCETLTRDDFKHLVKQWWWAAPCLVQYTFSLSGGDENTRCARLTKRMGMGMGTGTDFLRRKYCLLLLRAAKSFPFLCVYFVCV